MCRLFLTIIKLMSSTSWYLDDFLNSDNLHFKQHGKSDIQDQQLNKARASGTEAPFSDLCGA